MNEKTYSFIYLLCLIIIINYKGANMLEGANRISEKASHLCMALWKTWRLLAFPTHPPQILKLFQWHTILHPPSKNKIKGWLYTYSNYSNDMINLYMPNGQQRMTDSSTYVHISWKLKNFLRPLTPKFFLELMLEAFLTPSISVTFFP